MAKTKEMSDKEVPVKPAARDEIGMRMPRSRHLHHQLTEANEARLAELRKHNPRTPEEEAEMHDLEEHDVPPPLTAEGQRRLAELKARENVQLSVEDAATLTRLEGAQGMLTPDQERQLVALRARGPLSAEEKEEMGTLQAAADRRVKYDEERAHAADTVAAGPFSVEQWRHLREHIVELHDHAMRARSRRGI